VIIRTLSKWHSKLLGSPIVIYTDHQTLKNFDHQKDLSCCQAHWMEFLSQYDHQICYIKDEDNCVADALSCLPNNLDQPLLLPIAAMFSIQSDSALLKSILDGYSEDPFCIKLKNSDKSIEGVRWKNGLLYIGDRLVIPRVGSFREDLFHLTHDSLGHIGFDKSYVSLRDMYYWPNMQWDLHDTYIPCCVKCQQNKGRTSKPPSPLHPLLIPDKWRFYCN
jgi:hypothetical protein